MGIEVLAKPIFVRGLVLFNGSGTAARDCGGLDIREGADFPFRGLGINDESSEAFDAMIFEAEMRH